MISLSTLLSILCATLKLGKEPLIIGLCMGLSSSDHRQAAITRKIGNTVMEQLYGGTVMAWHHGKLTRCR